MISVLETQELIRRHVLSLAPETCVLNSLLRERVLREEVASSEDMPAFDRSAMDGYAVRIDETNEELEVVDEIRAGDFLDRELKPGHAVRIFTGGRLPGPGLKVVMQENVEQHEDRIRIIKKAPESHVRQRGEDARAGEKLLASGHILDATAISLLASIGKTSVQVSLRPRILHVTTGDEVVAPEIQPAPGQIRNSNAPLIANLCQEYGPATVTQFHARDDRDEIIGGVMNSGPAESFDMILVSGGSGPGNYDFTAELFYHLGVTIHCRQINVRPGKPLIFGTIPRDQGPQVVFGLPGNALSHFVCFHLFVRCALDCLMARPSAATIRAILAEALPDSMNARETWWPVRAAVNESRLECRALPWKSSGDITRLPMANALIKVPASTSHLDAGTMVELLPTGNLIG